MLVKFFSFFVAISILVAIHELGHFLTALVFRVKVLRFSIGFGPRLLSWRSARLGTEFSFSLLPFGGYVRFLDDQETETQIKDRQHAFNTQPVYVRAAIAFGGPLANFILAFVLYLGICWVGAEQPRAILGHPLSGSLSAQAGIQSGDEVLFVRIGDNASIKVHSFEDLQKHLVQSTLDNADLTLEVANTTNGIQREVLLPLGKLDAKELDTAWLRRVGITAPASLAQIGKTQPAGAAHEAGLQTGDIVLQVNQVAIADSLQLKEIIRSAVNSNKSLNAQIWLIEREDRHFTVQVIPKVESSQGITVGRVGAFIGAPPAMVLVRYGFWEGVTQAANRVWDVSVLSLQMIGKILTGNASLKNLSGPISIADFAGQSASLGAMPFILFLALISVSLGVLNLLPLPVLDGGHLMYYLWESVTGAPVSEIWMEQLAKVGLVILFLIMSVAVFNDIARLWG
jgi:regulator of sigma E protease